MSVESNWNRRQFLGSSFLCTAGILLPMSELLLPLASSSRKLTILHTNDTHSQIDPFPTNHPMYAQMGGVAKRAELIAQIREQENNVLLLDAGDIFQGTPYFNRYKGLLEMKLMSKMNYDLATMGNHDFDIGLDGFLRAKKEANFDFVTANYDFSNTILQGQTKSYKIFQKGAIKVGVFGLGIELEGLVPPLLYGETRYLDPIETAQAQVRNLKEKDCDLIVCLSHLGFQYENEKVSDVILAQKTRGIDLIIGGHTHTFLSEPVIKNNLDYKPVLIHQVGWGGINLGRIDFFFEKETKRKSTSIPVQNGI